MSESPSPVPGTMPAIDVAAGLLFRDGRLLIAQRPCGSHLAGLWEFPGGKREADESWEDCLRRELREELGIGIEVAVWGLFEEVNFTYPQKRVRLRFYLARLLEGEPQPIGCAAIKWIQKADLKIHAFPPADATLIQNLESEEILWSI